MPVESLSHITFIVKDIERTAKLFETVFGARIVYSSGPETHSLSPEIFLTAGGLWLALMSGEPLAERTYNHVAFRVSPDEFEGRLSKIREAGVDILEGRSRIEGEARSVYFYDYDNHLFEIHSGTLEDRLKAYAGPLHENR